MANNPSGKNFPEQITPEYEAPVSYTYNQGIKNPVSTVIPFRKGSYIEIGTWLGGFILFSAGVTFSGNLILTFFVDFYEGKKFDNLDPTLYILTVFLAISSVINIGGLLFCLLTKNKYRRIGIGIGVFLYSIICFIAFLFNYYK